MLRKVVATLSNRTLGAEQCVGEDYDFVVQLVREYGKYPLNLGEYDIPTCIEYNYCM